MVMDLLCGNFMGQGLPVWTVGSHGIVGVANSQDSSFKTPVIAAQTIWITIAILPFVVLLYDVSDCTKEMNRLKYTYTD